MVKPKSLADRSNSRDQLIAMAAKLFAQKGYNKTNLRDLADAVGMKAGSIFYHFSGKEEILYEVMESSINMLMDRVEVDMREADSTRDQLRVLIRSELEHYLGDASSYAMVLIHEWRSLSAELQAPLMVLRKRYELLWDEVLLECHRSGLILANPKIVRRMLNGAFSWVPNWFHEDGGHSHEELVDEVMLMLLKE